MMYFLAKHLVYTENYLNHGKEFIYGDKYTAADCLLTVLLHRVNEMRFYDVFDGKKINKEYTKKEKKKYPGLTRFVDGIQIAGSKVFEFKWIIIKK